jgi:class 3 adenylate cyclase
MRRLLLLDDSQLLAARLRAVLGPEWIVAGPGEETPDAVVVNPSWRDWEGLELLTSLQRRFGSAGSAFAVLDVTNAAVEFLLAELAVPSGVKDDETLAAMAARWNEGGAPGERSDEQNQWALAVRDWTAGRRLGPADASPFGHLFTVVSQAATLEAARAQADGLPGGSSTEVTPFLEALERLGREEAEVEGIHRVFSRFLPPEVIGSLMRKKSTTALLTGEKRRVVAFFSHVRDFGFYLEHNEPQAIVEFLNRHFQLYSDIIRKHGGFINKYIGDAVFALFGAPVSYLDNADRALAAAMEIAAALKHLEHPGIVLPPEGCRVGIGLNEGLSIVGNIGSTDSFDYTAIGDAVNLAARLESLNKHYQTEILLSDGLRASLNPETAPVLRTVDRAKVKGKKTATTFYTVVARSDAETPGFLDAYEKGLKMVKIGNWLTALDWLDRALALKPDDTLCQRHLKRVHDYAVNPPEWDGAEELSFK